MTAGFPRDEKLCEGCGKDLSSGDGFDDGTTRIGIPRTLWRCAPCKVAKVTTHLTRLEAAVNEAISIVGRADGRGLENDDAAAAYRLLADALTENYGVPA
jgi:hypothetical protein